MSSRAHTQSWGTKGSDKVSEDLGVVKSDGQNSEVTVEVPTEQHDINAMYAAELKTLATKAPKEVTVISGDQKQEDYYKNFRTNVGGQWSNVRWDGLTIRYFWLGLCRTVLSLLRFCKLKVDNIGMANVRQTSDGNSSLATTYMGILL